MITQRLNALKAEKNYSWQELSDLTGIPVPTIRKTFSGETVSPSYEVVSKLMTAMGATLAEVREVKEETQGDEDMQAAMEQIKAVYEDRIKDLWRIIDKISAEKRTLFYTMLGTITALLTFIIYLFVDGMHGNWGFFRY